MLYGARCYLPLLHDTGDGPPVFIDSLYVLVYGGEIYVGRNCLLLRSLLAVAFLRQRQQM
jgi:hypothetical protein